MEHLQSREAKSAFLSKPLARGAIVWALYAAAYVAVRGLVVDQLPVAAEIISGDVQYPPGHPFGIFHQHVFSLFNYLGAGFWALFPGPALTAFRNWLFLFLSAYSTFALTVVLTRQATWSYVASAIAVSGAVVEFQGRYPLFIFPQISSDGHIGLHAALIGVALLLAGVRGPAGFLLGLMPSIHAVMAAILWPWTAGYLLRQRGDRFLQRWRGFLIWASLGAFVCIGLAVFIKWHTAHLQTLPPYDVSGDSTAIIEQFTRITDYHREPIELFSVSYLVAPIAFFGLGLVLRRMIKDAGNEVLSSLDWILLLGAGSWLIVYVAAAARATFGVLPVAIEGAMPYRFSNVGVVALLPLAVALIARCVDSARPAGRTVLVGYVVALVAGVGLLQVVVPGPRVGRSLGFLVLGSALGLATWANWRNRRAAVGLLLLSAVLAGSIVLVPQSSSELLRKLLALAVGLGSAGAVGFASGTRLNAPELSPRKLAAALTCTALLASVAPFRVDPAARSPISAITPFDLRLKAWFEERGLQKELVLVSINLPIKLQAKIKQPQLLEGEIIYFMQYMPELAPRISMMINDLHGIDYSAPIPLAPNERLSTRSRRFTAAWPEWPQEHWQDLSRKYNFRFVLSKVPLQLPVVVPGPEASLYEIPARPSADPR